MHDQKWTLSCVWKVFSMEMILFEVSSTTNSSAIFALPVRCKWQQQSILRRQQTRYVLDISTPWSSACNWQALLSTLSQFRNEKLFHPKNIGKVFHLYSTQHSDGQRHWASSSSDSNRGRRTQRKKTIFSEVLLVAGSHFHCTVSI